MINSIQHVLSVDELKVSALILCLLALTGVAGYECIYAGDISANLKDLLEVIVAAITGINVIGRGFSRGVKNETSKH